jgi:hypothetical protein
VVVRMAVTGTGSIGPATRLSVEQAARVTPAIRVKVRARRRPFARARRFIALF